MQYISKYNTNATVRLFIYHSHNNCSVRKPFEKWKKKLINGNYPNG